MAEKEYYKPIQKWAYRRQQYMGILEDEISRNADYPELYNCICVLTKECAIKINCAEFQLLIDVENRESYVKIDKHKQRTNSRFLSIPRLLEIQDFVLDFVERWERTPLPEFYVVKRNGRPQLGRGHTIPRYKSHRQLKKGEEGERRK